MHSIKECKRFHELTFLQKQGIIKNLKCQQPFIVCDKVQWNQYDSSHKKLTPIRYISDFVYFDTQKEQMIVEDTKGQRTRLYILKRQLFIIRYPEYIFLET